MPVESPVSERLTVVSLLLLTFSTGIVDAISVLVLGHVFVANMTGNVIFLGFWFAPRTVVDIFSYEKAKSLICAQRALLCFQCFGPRIPEFQVARLADLV